MRIYFTSSEVLTLVVFCCFPPCHPTAATMVLDGVLNENEKSIQDLGDSTPPSTLHGIPKSTQQTRDRSRSRSRSLIFPWEGLGATTMTMEMVRQVEVEAVERVKGPGEG